MNGGGRGGMAQNEYVQNKYLMFMIIHTLIGLVGLYLVIGFGFSHLWSHDVHVATC
jgi:hypothetical protein